VATGAATSASRRERAPCPTPDDREPGGDDGRSRCWISARAYAVAVRTPPRLLPRSCLGLVPLLALTTACFVDPPTIELPGSGTSEGSSSDEGPADSSAGATSTTGVSSSSGSLDADDIDDDTTTDPSTTSGSDDPSTGAPADTSTGEPATPRLVFITEGAFYPNLGGVPGADARCAAEAEAAGHRGEFLAWISDAALSPADRFVREGGPWVRADAAVVAEDWPDLTDGTLASAIDLDAEGLPIDDQLAVWTNTDWNGLALAADCQGWTSMAFADAGIFGDFASAADFGQWTAWGDPTPFPCENTFHLYCFEQ